MLKKRKSKIQKVEPLAVSIKEACQLMCMGRTSLYELVRDGGIPAKKVGRKKVIILVSDIKDYLEGLPEWR